jgi:hypothetical protein
MTSPPAWSGGRSRGKFRVPRLAEALAELPPGTAARGEIVRVFVHGDVPNRLIETAHRAPDGTLTWTTRPVR